MYHPATTITGTLTVDASARELVGMRCDDRALVVGWLRHRAQGQSPA